MSFNLKALGKVLAIIFLVNGIALLAPIPLALYYNDVSIKIYLIPGGISLALSLICFLIFNNITSSLRIRDAYLSVILCWIIWSVFGAIPYYASGISETFIDAFFEAVSGYTTTGATLLSEWTFPNSLAFWRVLTHWLGGMGILIFIISVLPSFGVGSQRIAAAEAPGPGFNKTSAKMGDLARNLYLIYMVLTIAVFLLLLFAPGTPMSAFDSLINAMGCISTSGLFLHEQGIAYYDSLYIEVVISIFTILAATNFVLYLHLIEKNFSDLKSNIEIRVFIAMIFVMGIIVSCSLWFSNTYSTAYESFRHGFFQTISFITTTGYTLGDYTTWPTIAIVILFSTLFIGGCAASTSGSVKIIRVIVAFKLVTRGFYKRLHPRAVRSIRIGHKNISSPIVNSISAFLILYFTTFIIGSIVLSLQNLDMETTLSATASLMSSTGITFGEIGGTGNYAIFESSLLRLFMPLLMIIGRLELFTVFLLFMPSFWDPDRTATNR